MHRRTLLGSIAALLVAPLLAFGKQLTPKQAATLSRTPEPLLITGTHFPAVEGIEPLLLSIKGSPARLQEFTDSYMRALPQQLQATIKHDRTIWRGQTTQLLLFVPAGTQPSDMTFAVAVVKAIRATNCFADHAVCYMIHRVDMLQRYDETIALNHIVPYHAITHQP